MSYIIYMVTLFLLQSSGELKTSPRHPLSGSDSASNQGGFTERDYASKSVIGPARMRFVLPETTEVDGQWDRSFVLPGPNFGVSTVAADSDAVYVAGTFDMVGTTPAKSIAMWIRHTGSWYALGEGLGSQRERNPWITSIAIGRADTIFVAGDFAVNDDIYQSGAALWDGEEWRRIDGENDQVHISRLGCHAGALYAGGSLAQGDSVWSGVLKWDNDVWAKASEGIDGRPTDFAIDSAGEFYLGGTFQCTEDRVCAVAKLDGSEWVFLDSYFSHNSVVQPRVVSLSVRGDSVLVSGIFDSIGNVAANHVGLWNGSEWELLGNAPGGPARPSAIDADGNLFAISSALVIHKWEGTQWESLGNAPPFEVTTLETFGNEMFVGGPSAWTDEIAPAAYHMKWFDGETWRVLGDDQTNGVSGTVLSLSRAASGVYLGGRFEFAGTRKVDNVALWDGGTMSDVGGGLPGFVTALAFDGQSLYAGGWFTHSENADIKNIARWDGRSWRPLGRGIDGQVNAISVRGSNVFVGGSFKVASNTDGSVEVENVAVWTGDEWLSLGGGTSASVHALVHDEAGALYAGGFFTHAGDTEASAVAKWQNGSWHALGAGFNRPVTALAISGGILYAGGSFSEQEGAAGNHIARWDGASWSPMGAGLSGDVLGLNVDSDGNLYAAGKFLSSDGSSVRRVASWNGERWVAIGNGVENQFGGYFVSDILAVRRDIYIGGRFEAVRDPGSIEPTYSANVARWNERSSSGVQQSSLPAQIQPTEIYPNPTSGPITVAFTLVTMSHVVVGIYDLQGREVIRLVDQVMAAGTHHVAADLSKLPSGMYYCNYTAGTTAEARKVLLIK